MLKEAFFDTNLFLYAYSRAEEDRDKRDHAREIFGQFRPVISPQVIQEFIAAALRKPIMGINESKLDEFLSLCAVYRLQPLTLNNILYATALRRRFSLSHWDSSILAAAHASGCFILFSEDLQHGFQLDHLRIINPFK